MKTSMACLGASVSLLVVIALAGCTSPRVSETKSAPPVSPPEPPDAAAPLDQHFQALEFLPLQSRLRQGLKGLSKPELFAAAQLLLSASAKANEDLGLKLLDSLSENEVPCISYYRAESRLRRARYAEALTALERFTKATPLECDEEKGTAFNCCPQSKHRNATGLEALARARMKRAPKTEVFARLDLVPQARALRAPLVVWEKKAFLLDTGAEHTVWNTRCARELGLKLDARAKYGGSDSLDETLVAVFAEPKKKVLGLEPENLTGFAFDLGEKDPSNPDFKLCGIVSPQQVIPKGVMAFDWNTNQVLLCQGDACRASLKVQPNCPMYMFNGRPYVDAAVSGGSPRLFLIDTGATSTSANLNYFRVPPELQRTTATVAGATQKTASVDVIAEATVEFCGLAFKQKPFGVRPPSQSWEWRENGKIGMNLLLSSLAALDFGRGAAEVK